jgi:O-acetyl-ADP-ribose deacetylase (regulator of RNase III)
MLVWYYGAKVSREALQSDHLIQKLEEENQKLKNDLQELKKQRIQVIKAIELHHDIPYIYQVRRKRGKKIALITGRIEDVKKADVWVSSENTDMQMARFYDRSVSGVVRYYGAKKDTSGNVTDDTIAKELKLHVANNVPVSPTSVFVTGSGELQKDNNVKKIFHVASVRGEPGIGYVPIENIQYCVTKVLTVADSENTRNLGIKSILFPLLGVGTASGQLEDIVPKLIKAAVSYFEATENSTIEYIYFLSRTDVDRDACLIVLKELAQLDRLELIHGSY